ncbi:MAG: hypothetical protein R3F20_05450 [Planctomycetota bacterium]
MFDVLNDLILEHWAKVLTGAALFVVGRWWGKKRARADWRKREFMHRVNVSLNHVEPRGDEPGLLQLRTLMEADASEILKNEAGVEILLAAAGKTTVEDPVIHLGAEGWTILNAVLNEVAEVFAAGTLARDLGMPVRSKRYLFALTNERDGDVKTRKVRALFLPEEFTAEDGGPFREDLALESPRHVTRVRTIRAMLDQYARSGGESGDFMWVELSVPAGG